MTGILISWDGGRFRLPSLLSWTLRYGSGTPCDSFELSCLWSREGDARLSEAVRFEAEEGGGVVFRGVVDEYELRWDEKGGRLFLSGRGMAALLLDNEAESAEYQVATLDDILRRHVTPYGIETAERAQLSAVSPFTVENGSSEWQVLYNFARYHSGVEPRFDRQGRLVLTCAGSGRLLSLDSKAAVAALSFREKRYGILSEVLVRDRVGRSTQRLVNEEFLRRGGRCRRVITVPGRSSYQAMRYSGQFQLDCSAEERLRLELRLSGRMEAWPGDRIDLGQRAPGGIWRVLETEHSGGEKDGLSTVLTLGQP